MIGLDLMGAPWSPRAPVVPQDEVKAPVRVVLSPKGAGSTVFGDPQRGIPSGVVRIVITGGSYWQSDPGFQRDTNNWDDSSGWPPSATLWLTNGSKQTFTRLQAVVVTGGLLKRGGGRWGWLSRFLAIGVDPSIGSTASTLTDVFSIVHPVGEGVLSAFGAGGLAKPLGEWEQKGVEATMTPAELAEHRKKQAAKQAAAAEAAKQQQAAAAAQVQAARPSRFWWVVGGAVVAVIAGVLVFGRRRPA